MNSIQHWLLYGDPGSGKSTAAATFPKPALVFMFDPLGKDTPYLTRGEVVNATWEGTPVKEVHGKDGHILFRIEYFHDSDPQKPTAYRRFLARLVTLDKDVAEWGIKTVIIDSTTFMELAARKLSQYVLNPTSKEPRQWFAASTDTLEEVLMIRFGSLPLNVVVVSHVNEDKDELHGMYVRNPALPGRMSKRAPAGFSELYRAYTVVNRDGSRDYLWQTKPNALYNASSQINAPDPCVATYSALWLPQ